MNRISTYLALFLMLITASTMSAQLRGHCGMTHEQEQMLPRYSRVQIAQWKAQFAERNAEINIPVTFHLVADVNGDGRIKRRAVLKTMHRMNEEYAPYGIQFYLKNGGFNEINNDAIFDSPGADFNINQIISHKEGSSVDIFICNNADSGSGLGTTLGYYLPGADYVVIRKKEFQDSSGTITHEVGHYFSLMHPHSGWREPYDRAAHGDTVPFTNTPSGALIELMDGSNCSFAADGLCDTPPDYLLGFGTNTCVGDLGVYDPNGDRLVSNAKLSMGYFNSCPRYVFSPEQIVKFKMNYSSSIRDFLRSDDTPNATPITGDFEFVSPAMSQQLFEEYNAVELSWQGVENAEKYLVEIQKIGDANSLEYIVEDPAMFVTDLEPDATYFVLVKPFNDGYMGYPTQSTAIKTGSDVSSTSQLDFVNHISVFPNPVFAGANINISLDIDYSGAALVEIKDISGKVVLSENRTITQGAQTITLSNVQYVASGVYMLTIDTAKGVINKKVIIQ